MIRKLVFLLLIWIVGVYGISPAKISKIGDFKLENGQTILDCKIAYRTFGKLNEDSSNVIIYPTWFVGTTAHLASVSVPGKIVDSTKYFIVAVAALGNGESSSPSNSKLQPDKKFPQFNIRDMVHSQYAMLKKEFGFENIRAVVGGSMGSMQAYEWLVRYPDFMDKAVLYVGSPKLTSSDILWFQIQKNMIKLNPSAPDSAWAIISAMTQFVARTTEHVSNNVEAETLEAKWESWRNKKHDNFSLYDYAAQLDAMAEHDIFKPFNCDKQKTADRIKADVLQIVSATDMLVSPQPALDFLKYFRAETHLLKGNCGHLEPGCQMGKVSMWIQDFLEN